VRVPAVDLRVVIANTTVSLCCSRGRARWKLADGRTGTRQMGELVGGTW
jgi:hypothetical protein